MPPSPATPSNVASAATNMVPSQPPVSTPQQQQQQMVQSQPAPQLMQPQHPTSQPQHNMLNSSQQPHGINKGKIGCPAVDGNEVMSASSL